MTVPALNEFHAYRYERFDRINGTIAVDRSVFVVVAAADVDLDDFAAIKDLHFTP